MSVATPALSALVRPGIAIRFGAALVAQGTNFTAATGATGKVTLIGRGEDATRVKDELVRQGVRADAIVVKSEVGSPLPKAGDGLSDPSDRRVTIKL